MVDGLLLQQATLRQGFTKCRVHTSEMSHSVSTGLFREMHETNLVIYIFACAKIEVSLNLINCGNKGICYWSRSSCIKLPIYHVITGQQCQGTSNTEK